ncbi:MAG: flagellar biosynthetic protein FliO [Steroidobacteraceae bacterium]
MKRSALNATHRHFAPLRRCAALAGLALFGAAGLAQAAAASASAAAASAPFASPAHVALPSTAGGLMRVMVALILVLAAIFAAAWVSRRVRSVGGARSSSLDVLAQLPLGPRERAVLVRVGEQQLLIGVTTGCIRTLHVLDSTTGATGAGGALTAGPDLSQRPSFKALLLKSLGK